jgi:hypothetical protein
VVDERTDLNRGANDDVIATDVRKRGEQVTRMVNIFDRKDARSGEREILVRKLHWQRVIRHGGTVLAGDFNGHSQRWDPRCQVQQDAVFWDELSDKNGLEIGNDGRPTRHWTREDQEGESVIDLTLAIRPIVKWTIMADAHATRSHHNVIEWEVGVDRQEEADHERVVGWNSAAIMEKDAEAAEKQWRELAKERAQLEAECTEDEVEQEALWCKEAISTVVDATAKKIRICARSKRWWNTEVKETRRTVRRERRRTPNLEEAARAKAELQKSILQSKRKTRGDYLQKLSGAEVLRAARYANPRAGMAVQALTDRWHASNHFMGEGGNAEARILSP